MLEKFLLLLALPVFAQPLDPSLSGYDRVKPPNRPNLKIVSPELNSTVLSSRITLEFITNISSKKHKLLVTFAREGYPVPEPQTFKPASPLIFENIPGGKYRVTLELVQTDTAGFTPPVKDTTKFSVTHPISPTPTHTPSPTATPMPLNQKIKKHLPLDKNEGLIILGSLLLTAPLVYLIMGNNQKS